MKGTAIIGLQVGDEGKGLTAARELFKLAESAKKQGKYALTFRFQGGANAGHTVEIDGKRFALHQIPSGIVLSKEFPVYSLIGTGCFVNPRILLDEIQELKEKGIDINPAIFGISANAQVTLDYHKWESQSDFNTGGAWASTGNGIKETGISMAKRKEGIRFAEFVDINSFSKIIKDVIDIERIKRIKDKEGNYLYPSYEDFIESYREVIEFFKDFLVLETDLFNNTKFIGFIAEGAQGAALDEWIGRRPGTTSSCPIRPRHRPNKIIGVFKLYKSSVGIRDRLFVSKMKDEVEEKLRVEWDEFGTTTKRPRNVGWFDAVEAKYYLQNSEVDEIVGTCLDRLEDIFKLGIKIKIVTAYQIGDKIYNKWDSSFSDRFTLGKAKPIYEEFDSWEKSVGEDGKLNPNAEKYISAIENFIGKKFSLLGVGPGVKNIRTR